ncbi:MAG: DNA repair exonuclease [Thermostichales cyanobacterium SZTDM-1c_bins_54]
MAVRFLHLADIHLGYEQFNHPERSKDFFYSFQDVVQRYAAQVDFVLIAGDLFENRDIKPNTLNQAQLVLKSLKQQGIPVLAIEGNHDSRPYGVRTSWLKYLEGQGWLYLLEPKVGEAGEVCLSPWQQGQGGGYVDLPCGVRVIGSSWYGSQTARLLPRLAEAVAALPKTVDSQILLLHQGLEGQIARYEGALRYQDLLPLHQAGITYLALGHIHKNYSAEGWIFNPGSLEANGMDEYDVPRGAYWVTLTGQQITAQLVQDYRQRPHVRLHWQVSGRATPQQVRQQILELVAAQGIDPQQQVMLSVKLTGELGFPGHELEQRRLEAQLQELTGALVARLTLSTSQYQLSGDPNLTPSMSRQQLERQVFGDLVAAHSNYRPHAQRLTELLVALKTLQGSPPAELYQTLEQFWQDDG